MIKNWFKGCIKIEHVRALFKSLAMQHHPDRGGDTRTMQDILAEYHEVLKSFEGTKLFNKVTNEEYSFRYDFRKEQAIADMVDGILKLKLANITLEVVGTWVWVSGTTREQARLFNRDGLGMTYTRQHNKWFWHPGSNSRFKRGPSGLSYDEIKNRYGSERVHGETNPQVN